MIDWQTLPLGDALTFQRGFDITREMQGDGPYAVISSSGPKSNHSEYKVTGPGVIIGRKGTLGSVYYSEKNFWPHDTTLWVKDFHGNEPKFAYYFLKIMGFERLDAGASNPSLNRNHIHTIPVLWPPLHVQQRIAGILSAYDDLIENSQRRIKILEAMARALYREWFVNFHFPGHEGPLRVPPKLGELPAGWQAKQLGDVVDDIIDYRGKTPTKLNGDWSDEGIPALSALNVKGGRLVNLDKSKHVDNGLYLRWMKNPLRQGDILMTSEAPLGELYYLCNEEVFCLSQRLFSIRANSRIIAPIILYMYLESEQAQHDLRSRSSGATVSGIRQSELRKIPIIVPPVSVQEQLGPILQSIAKQKHILDTQVNNLRRTRDLLLPRLLSGQIDVEVA